MAEYDRPLTADMPDSPEAERTQAACNQPEQNLHKQALEWQVILWSGEVTEQEHNDFNVWLNTSTAHQHAWQRLQKVNKPFAEVPDAIASRVLRSPADMKRRKVLGSLALLIGVGVVAYQVPQTPQWRAATADYRTGKGERRTASLPDGTEITLNTASAVGLQFTRDTRRIYLHHGEIQVVTAVDTTTAFRPFIVETFAGTIRPIGTRFTVRRTDDAGDNLQDSVQVEVFEGAVELSPRDLIIQGNGLRVSAGQKARFNASTAGSPETIQAADGAWVRGLLVAERQPLGDFIANLSRYRTGILRCDPAVKHLVVSGVYPIDDTDAVLQSLARALPIRLRSITPYWVTVTAP